MTNIIDFEKYISKPFPKDFAIFLDVNLILELKNR